MLEMPKSHENLPGGGGVLHTGSGTGPKERSRLQATKLEGRSHLSPLISDIKLQDLEFALLGLGLALICIYSICPHFFLSGMVIDVL